MKEKKPRGEEAAVQAAVGKEIPAYGDIGDIVGGLLLVEKRDVCSEYLNGEDHEIYPGFRRALREDDSFEYSSDSYGDGMFSPEGTVYYTWFPLCEYIGAEKDKSRLTSFEEKLFDRLLEERDETSELRKKLSQKEKELGAKKKEAALLDAGYRFVLDVVADGAKQLRLYGPFLAFKGRVYRMTKFCGTDVPDDPWGKWDGILKSCGVPAVPVERDNFSVYFPSVSLRLNKDFRNGIDWEHVWQICPIDHKKWKRKNFSLDTVASDADAKAENKAALQAVESLKTGAKWPVRTTSREAEKKAEEKKKLWAKRKARGTVPPPDCDWFFVDQKGCVTQDIQGATNAALCFFIDEKDLSKKTVVARKLEDEPDLYEMIRDNLWHEDSGAEGEDFDLVVRWLRKMSAVCYKKKVYPRILDWYNAPRWSRTGSPSGSAYRYFSALEESGGKDGAEILNKLGLRLIDGEYPGDDTLSVRIQVTAEEANEIAQDHKADFRFKKLPEN